MPPTIQHAALAASLCLGVPACIDSPDSIVEVGAIELESDPAMISVPTSARAGEPFLVSVVTYGDGCTSFESTEVTAAADGVDVVPYVRTAVGQVCPLPLLLFLHEASVAFATPGTKTLRFHGRRVTRNADEPIEILATIFVE